MPPTLSANSHPGPSKEGRKKPDCRPFSCAVSPAFQPALLGSLRPAAPMPSPSPALVPLREKTVCRGDVSGAHDVHVLIGDAVAYLAALDVAPVEGRRLQEA